MNTPLVSIIIPTYNRAHLIGETLDSVLAQTYKNWECIVVDDGSTDYTDELLEFYTKKNSRIQYHHRPTNRKKGANACRNYGFELSEGEYVNWFDSDDLLNQEFLHLCVLAICECDADFSVCNAQHFLHDQKSILRDICNKFSKNILLEYITGAINLNTPVILWKRDSVEHFRFDETLSRAQELDFHFRILKHKELNPVFVNKYLVLIRTHENSLSGNYHLGKLASIQSELDVRSKILEYVVFSNLSSDVFLASLKIYLMGFRKLYQHYSLKRIYEELARLEALIRPAKKYYYWKFKFLNLLLIYKLSSREFRLKKHLFELKDYVHE